jgi:hypothetical protein
MTGVQSLTSRKSAILESITTLDGSNLTPLIVKPVVTLPELNPTEK